jgi:hypothetical protein
MREYGQVQCSFWSDPDVQELSDQAKLLFAYLLTGPHSNGLGCYRLPDGYVQADFGWSFETVRERFTELFEKGFIERCESTNFVVILNFLKWNPVSNGNVATARAKEFETVPSKATIYFTLINELLTNGKHWSDGFINHLETLYQTLLEGYAKQDPTQPYQEPNPNQDPDPDPERDPEDLFTDSQQIEKKPPSRFDEFWQVFDDKRGKQGAARVWNRKKLDNIADVVIEGARRYVDARGIDQRYWKQAQGWLNDGRWEDDVITGPPSKSDVHAYNQWAIEEAIRMRNEREQGVSNGN